MSTLHNIFLSSEADFFVELEKKLGDLSVGLDTLAAKVADLTAILGEVYRPDGAPYSDLATIKSWVYDVRFPNYLMSNVYDLERYGEFHQRWVGPEPLLTFTVHLDRSRQYDLGINVVSFANEDLRASFTLHVDGHVLPWTAAEGTMFRAIVPEGEAGGPALRPAAIAIGPSASCPSVNPSDPRLLSFCFSSISIEMR